MIKLIVPQFFTTDMAATFSWYQDKLGFKTDFLYGEPPFYGGVIRDNQMFYFRHQDELRPFEANKYEQEFLDAMVQVNDIDALYKEFQRTGAEFQSELNKAEWGAMNFIVKDPDGRLICFAEITADD